MLAFMKSAVLRLAELMRGLGVRLPERLNKEELREAQLAAGRCERCAAKSPCDEALRAGRYDGFKTFCPNARYLERRTSLDFTLR